MRNATRMPQNWTCADATGTPQTSPITNGTGEVTLVWPTNAIRLNVYAASAAVTLRTTSGSDTKSFPIAAATVFTIPGIGGASTIIQRGSATTLHFLFELLA